MKFVISAERFADACTVTEYLGVVVGNIASQMKVLPKMLVDDNGNYIIEVILDSDGDVTETKNIEIANGMMEKISVRRFEKLRKELTEAARNIVNPPNGRGLNAP